ncbi:MAG: PEP-CTERM sorting domain-containing protein [Nitrospiraceae bacterium]|nr:MAG: PEP-CTERM sorting domain-containing protein [Nitrospiraceae bacterium]
MKAGNLLAVIAVWGVWIFTSGIADASPGARILYQETELGSGLWQYDYTFSNASDADEYLFNVWLDFGQEAEVTGLTLPEGWMGATVWEGTNRTAYLDPVSTDYSYDIPAGNSLGGFSFTIGYQAGSIPFTAYFDDHNGGDSYQVAGSTEVAIVPEPVSIVLFMSGGAALAARRLRNRGQVKFPRTNY